MMSLGHMITQKKSLDSASDRLELVLLWKDLVWSSNPHNQIKIKIKITRTHAEFTVVDKTFFLIITWPIKSDSMDNISSQ